MPENKATITSLIGQVCPQADCTGILAAKCQGAECTKCKTYINSPSDWRKICRQTAANGKSIVLMHAVNIAGEGF